MYYHPLLGIIIFISAIVLAFFLGRSYIKKKLNLTSNNKYQKTKTSLPKGEITSPDAPWLNKK